MWGSRARAIDVDRLIASARFTPLTPFEGTKIDADISPDGKWVAFLSDRDGPFHVWLNRVGTGSLPDLTPGAGDQRNPGLNRAVGFSPDGSEIWFNGGFGGRLQRMPIMGGPPRAFLSDHAINVAWSRDGSRLVYFTSLAGDPLFVADGTGGNARQIFASDNEDHNHFPAWSPDGRWIYYAHGSQSLADFDVWRIASNGGKPERLTDRHANIRYLTPLDDHTVLFIAPDDDGEGPWLWALNVDHRTVHRINAGLERFLSIAASSDAQHLVASISTATAGLWSVPIRNEVADDKDVTAYRTTAARALAPRFAGSSTLFFLSSTGTGDGLWRWRDGTAVELWKGLDGALVEPPAVSPKGDRLALLIRKDRKLQLTVLSSDGAEHHSIAETIDVHGTATWSPNGTRIVVGGQDRDGPGLFSVPADGGAPVRIWSGAATDPVWSPDGEVIVYTAEEKIAAGKTLTAPHAITPDGHGVALPAIPLAEDYFLRWQRRIAATRFVPNSRAFIYLQGPIGAQTFWRVDLATNSIRKVVQLSGEAAISAFDITPDGTHIIFDRLRENSNLVLIDLPH